MTTTVIVKARAHGAKVILAEKQGDDTTNHTEFEIGPNADRTFNITEAHSLTIEQGVPTEEQPLNPRPFEGEKVPGAAENDALLGNTQRDDADELE